jgi:hypothetical protein
MSGPDRPEGDVFSMSSAVRPKANSAVRSKKASE